MEDIKCPKCASTSIHADKKGFSTGKAVAGTLIGNPVVGALAGTHGSNKIIMTCLNCGHEFKPGEQLRSRPIEEKLPEGVHVHKFGVEENFGIKCSYCGKLSSTSMGACPQCGRRFTPAEKEAAKQNSLQNGNKPPKGGCLGMVVLFIVVGGLFSVLI
jgi:ssDNA-binding Zn-finger/Zn-ribbon topoisomerase 1